jgi:hypothetical protein
MRHRLSLCGAVVILITLYSAMAGMSANEDAPPFDVDRLLKGPDHKDFPWRVWTTAHYLTVQQRFGARVEARINGGSLQNRALGRDMHFVVKVGNADGRWVPDYSYTRVRVPPGLDNFQVQFSSGIYLRPGRYVIALVVYDDLIKKQNVWRKLLTVDRVKNDPLPEIDRNLPDVEFRVQPIDEELKFYSGDQSRKWLPVKNNRCLCVDIVANTSVDNVSRGRDFGRMQSSSILNISSVLSNLGLRNGRVRVTILDALEMKTLVYREDAAGFDLQGKIRLVARQNPDTIDIDSLASQTQASAYLFDTLHEILKDDACVPDKESPLKIVIVVSTDMVFAKHTPIRQIAPQDPASVLFFHFRTRFIPAADDLSKMLKTTNCKAYTVRDGSSFREDLADLISRLEKFAK